MSFLSPLKKAVKAIPFPGGNQWQGTWGWGGYRNSSLLPGTKINYATEVGDLMDNSAVYACVAWVARVWPESPLEVWQTDSTGERNKVPNHPLTFLLKKPNPYYNPGALWFGTLLSLNSDGNAYWVKVRNRLGEPVELYYLPHFAVSPRWPQDGSEFVSHYEYNVDGKIVRLAREDVIHFRNGIDPYNQRLGMSPLRSVLREVYTDIEAANYSAALVRNMGAVPALISPDPAVFKEAGAVLSRERAEEMKEQWVRRSTGDERGKPLVQSVPVKIQGGQDFVFSPEQMAVRELRKIPEERICAVLGIPPGVVGLGAGLDRNTFSNMREGREQAYESNVIPTHWLVSQEMDRSLLVDYTDDPTYSTGFDISKVRVLAEDEDQISKRVVNEYKEGVITRGEGRSKLGYEDRGAEDEVYYPGTDPDTVAEEQEEQAAAAAERLEGMREQQRDGVGANGNGNGNGPAMRSIDGTLVPPGHYYIVGESGGAQPFDPRRSSLKVQELLAEAGAAGRAADAAGAAGHGAGHTGEDGAAHRENGRDGAGGPGAHGA